MFQQKQLAALITASSVLLPGFVTAAPLELEEVVVTAQKRAQSVQDIPMSVSAFDGDSLRQMGATDSASIVARTPGMGGAKDGDSQSIISIRGISTGAFSPGADNSVGTYFNEIPVSRNIGGMGFLDIERVEVVKGPQGTLFGRNTSSGAISITNAAADLQEDTLDLMAGVGNESQLQYEIVANKALSDNFAVRLAAKHDERDGTGENVDGDEVNNRDHDQYRLSVQWDASDSVNVKAFYEKFEVQNRFQTYIDPNEMFTSHVSASSVGVPEQEVDNDLFVANIVVDLNDVLTLTSNTGYFESDILAIPNDIGDAGLAGGVALPFYAITFQELWEIEQFSQDFRINGATDNTDWFVGISYYNEEVLVDGAITVDPTILELPGDGVPSDDDIPEANIASNETTSYAIFGDITWNLSDTLALTVGARYTDEEKEAEAETISNLGIWLPTTGKPTAKNDWNSFDPRIAIDYQLSPEVLLYANWAKGFKSGGFNRFVDANNQILDFDPEENNAFEVGIKADILDDRARINAAVFQYDYTNFQLETAVGAALLIQSESDLTNRGFEFDGTFLIGDSIDLRVAYAYIDAEFDDAQAAGMDISGNKAARAPEQNYSILLTHSVPTNFGEFTSRIEYTHTDEQYFTVFEADNFLNDSYDLVNVRFSLRSDDDAWDVALVGENVTDEEYVNSALDLGIPFFMPGMGALWRLEGRYSF